MEKPMRKLLIVSTIAVWAALGCSSEKTEAGSVAQTGETAVKNTDAQPSSKPDREMAMAEARKQAQRHTKPAVDTTDLRQAPDWELKDLSGASVSSGDFAGRVVILDFWATWCGPCKMEIPHFKELYAEYQDKGLEIVGVSLDREGSAKVAPFAQKAAINYTMLLGNQKVVSDYAPIRGIPTTFVISQDGKIFKRYVGFRKKEVFENDIKTLLCLSS